MKNIKKAYSEVYEFLNVLSDSERKKIPVDIQKVFEYYKDDNYNIIIDKNKSIKEQNLQDETLDIIAMLNVDYLCNSTLEYDFYNSVYEQNDIIFQEKFNINRMFEKRKKYIKSDDNDTKQLVEYKKVNIFKKILFKVKQLFK